MQQESRKHERRALRALLRCAALGWLIGCGGSNSPAGGVARSGDGGTGGLDGGGSTGDANAWPPTPDLSDFSESAVRSVTIGISWYAAVAAGGVSGWMSGAAFRISEPRVEPSPAVC